MTLRGSQLESGVVIGGYRIDELISRGGMGVVYRATNIGLNRIYALKVLAPELADDQGFRERFRREMRIAASINHPNVVGIHYAGEQDGLVFFVMDFIHGTDLRDVLRKSGSLEPERAVDLLMQLASALDAAHARGLVHRDVKPANVLLTVDDGEEHVYLTDFGVAKRSDTAADLTAQGAVVGTVDYMSPQQITGRHTDARTDVYALGCVFFQMLTGAIPYDRGNSIAKLFAHVHESPPTVAGPLADHFPTFGPVLEKAMAKDPHDRYLSAGDLARDATAALRGTRYTGPATMVGIGDARPSDTDGGSTARADLPLDPRDRDLDATVAPSEASTPATASTPPAATKPPAPSTPAPASVAPASQAPSVAATAEAPSVAPASQAPIVAAAAEAPSAPPASQAPSVAGQPPATTGGPPRPPAPAGTGGSRRRYVWAGIAALIVIVGAVVAVVASGSGGSSSSSKPQFTASAQPVPTNRVPGSGTATGSLKGDQLAVTVDTNGLLNGAPHAMHIHAGGKGICPPASAAHLHNGHRSISTTDGIKFYGPPEVALTSHGDFSPKSIVDFSRYPLVGDIRYARTFANIPAGVADAIRAGNAVIVVHGIDYNGNHLYDDVLDKSELDPTLPGEATAPALCGTLAPTQSASTGAPGSSGPVYTASLHPYVPAPSPGSDSLWLLCHIAGVPEPAGASRSALASVGGGPA